VTSLGEKAELITGGLTLLTRAALPIDGGLTAD